MKEKLVMLTASLVALASLALAMRTVAGAEVCRHQSALSGRLCPQLVIREDVRLRHQP
jgi:hypothetical protein